MCTYWAGVAQSSIFLEIRVASAVHSAIRYGYWRPGARQKAHRVDVLALAQSALYSGARCALVPSPCCALRGERAPFFGRDGGGATARAAAAALSAACARTAARCPSMTRPEMVCAAQHTNLLNYWPKTAPFVSEKNALRWLRRLRMPAARPADIAFLAAAIRDRHKDVAHA